MLVGRGIPQDNRLGQSQPPGPRRVGATHAPPEASPKHPLEIWEFG